MTWQSALKADLDNVRRGKLEAGEDSTLIQSAIEQITDDTNEDAAANILVQCGVNHFAGLVMTGNYHRQVAEETDDDSV